MRPLLRGSCSSRGAAPSVSPAGKRWVIEKGKPESALADGTSSPSHRHPTETNSRNRAAADSAVMSRCGVPNISNPTINLRTVADRSSGG